MGRYQKFHSTFIRRKRYQTINGGVITERDWVTLGERHKFGPNKRAVYADGNFLFTTSRVIPYAKRHKNSTLTSVYTYDDVEDSTDEVNSVEPNINTNDIRTFCYYGSCVELVRATIENIITYFPASVTRTTSQLTVYVEDEEGNGSFQPLDDGYILNNPFNIDFHHDNVTLGKYDNPYRYLSATYLDYEVNGSAIIGYTIVLSNCDDNCACQYDVLKDHIVEIRISTEDAEVYRLYGYLVDTDIIYTCDAPFVLQPKAEVIEEYFKGLKGFEKQLLNRKSTPLYQNSFITPVMAELNYHYVERTYTWPLLEGSDYCIDVNNPGYFMFLSTLTDLATLMDELWTDNLYKNMTHEAIKNFDWTFTHDYIEGDEQDNVDGGERMQKILHIMARIFDDNKRYIDTIALMNKQAYNGYNNMPSAVLSDKLGYAGWDITSTIPVINGVNMSDVYLDTQYLEYNSIKWYPTQNPEEVTPATSDIEFMGRLLLSSAHIWRAKGTKHSIEMVMGLFGFTMGEDYDLIEQYYTVAPKGFEDTVEVDGDATDDKSGTTYKYVLGDIIPEINEHKESGLTSGDSFIGLPLELLSFPKWDEDKKEVIVTNYIIPYFDPTKYDDDEPYDGNLFFQQKGGWGKVLEDGESLWDLEKADNYDDKGGQDSDEILSHINYKETISYLHIVSTIGDLLNVNSREVSGGDIYYVANINDFVDYYDVDIIDEGAETNQIDVEAVTHFFMFRYRAYDASLTSSWMNVSLTEGVNEYDADIAKKVEYLDSLIVSTFGNNPHSGYGVYDCGIEYLQYMEKPFKYALDTNGIIGREEEYNVLYSSIAEKINFEISGPINVTNGIPDETATSVEEKEIDKFRRPTDGDLAKRQIINTKVLIFKNKVKVEDNDVAFTLYKDYFMNIILPYLMQVIPSTTILVLEGFSLTKDTTTAEPTDDTSEEPLDETA